MRFFKKIFVSPESQFFTHRRIFRLNDVVLFNIHLNQFKSIDQHVMLMTSCIDTPNLSYKLFKYLQVNRYIKDQSRCHNYKLRLYKEY